jgi:hypothetical protein
MWLILFSHCSLWAGQKPEVDFKAVSISADAIVVGRVNSVTIIDKIMHRSCNLGRDYEAEGLRAVVSVEKMIKGQMNEKEIIIEFPSPLKVRRLGDSSWNQCLSFESLNSGERAVLLLSTNDQQTNIYSFANEYRSVIPIADSSEVTQQLDNLQQCKPEEQIALLLTTSLNCYTNYMFIKNTIADLTNLQGNKAQAAITTLLDHSKDPVIRGMALTSLISGGDYSRLAEAVEILSSSPESNRLMNEKRMLSSQMGLITNADLIAKYYIPLMRHSDDFVRRDAAHAIRQARVTNAMPEMMDGLRDSDVTTRYECLMALGEVLNRSDVLLPSRKVFAENEAKYIKDWQNWWERSGRSEFDKSGVSVEQRNSQ